MLQGLENKRVTVVTIGGMAMTNVMRGTCLRHEAAFALEFMIFQRDKKTPRQRKVEQYKLRIDQQTLVFAGDLPFKADTEGGGSMHGNACYNFYGDVAVVRDWVENKNLNDKFNGFDAVMVVEVDESGFKSHFIPVFPETDTHSAPVEDYRKAHAMNEALVG